MAGNTNFPTALDDNTSLVEVSDGVTSLQAAHHNNLKEAIRAIEAKVGISLTDVPTSLDYRLGNATAGHRHDGASGQGPQINATAVVGLASYIAGSTAVSAPPDWFSPTSSRLIMGASYLSMEGRHATFRPRISIATSDAEIRAATIGYFRMYPTGMKMAVVVNENDGGMYMSRDGATRVMAGIAARSYFEVALNTYSEGGDSDTQHWLFGGWGLVLPALATSGIHATYSNEGQAYWDRANKVVKVYTGATWRSLSFV